MAQVSVQPLLSQHRDKGGEKRDQKARIQKGGGGDDLAGGTPLDGWNDSGFARDCGVVKSEEDCAKQSRRLIVGIGLKLWIDVDDESGTNRREQSRLRDQVRQLT